MRPLLLFVFCVINDLTPFVSYIKINRRNHAQRTGPNPELREYLMKIITYGKQSLILIGNEAHKPTSRAARDAAQRELRLLPAQSLEGAHYIDGNGSNRFWFDLLAPLLPSHVSPAAMELVFNS